MPARLVDLHCHLDLYPDYPAIVAECERAEVYTLAVTTTPRAWPRNLELTKGLKYVRAALGIHPQLVAESADEITLWEAYLPEARYVGEVGLDGGPHYHQSLPRQQRIFERVLIRCAEAGDKILSVHSVRTTGLVLDIIRANLPPNRGKVVLHWFTGSRKEAERALDIGCRFSVNPAMLTKETHRRLVSDLPLEALLTETDGPFTTTGSRTSRPSDAARVVHALGALRGLTFTAVQEQIERNLRALLSNPDEPS